MHDMDKIYKAVHALWEAAWVSVPVKYTDIGLLSEEPSWAADGETILLGAGWVISREMMHGGYVLYADDGTKFYNGDDNFIVYSFRDLLRRDYVRAAETFAQAQADLLVELVARGSIKRDEISYRSADDAEFWWPDSGAPRVGVMEEPGNPVLGASWSIPARLIWDDSVEGEPDAWLITGDMTEWGVTYGFEPATHGVLSNYVADIVADLHADD